MELAALLTSFLSPFLPHLLKLGQPVAEAAGKQLGTQLGEGTWETAKSTWTKLSPKVEAKPLAQGAALALSEDGQDKEAQEIFTTQLNKLLTADPKLAQALQILLNQNVAGVTQAVPVSQTVTGDRNIVIGSSSGSVNINQG